MEPLLRLAYFTGCAGLAFPAFLIVNLLFLVFWLVIYRKYALLSKAIVL